MPAITSYKCRTPPSLPQCFIAPSIILSKGVVFSIAQSLAGTKLYKSISTHLVHPLSAFSLFSVLVSPLLFCKISPCCIAIVCWMSPFTNSQVHSFQTWSTFTRTPVPDHDFTLVRCHAFQPDYRFVMSSVMTHSYLSLALRLYQCCSVFEPR